MKIVGLMSGTSGDGVDAALLEVDGTPPDAVTWRLGGFVGRPYDDALRTALFEAIAHGGAAGLADLHVRLAACFAEVVGELLDATGTDPEDVAAIASHGHTIWHRPPTRERPGVSWQLGDPATLAASTGIPVVSDFRAADVAAGGQGAPLVAWPDRVLFAHETEARILLNIGGMANLTWLPPRGDPTPPLAFDTGPGNVLLDLAAGAASGGRLRCDEHGALARAGRVDHALLDRLLDDPFFAQRPPRSTGREQFGEDFLADVVRAGWSRSVREPALPGPAWPDLLATLTALTAHSVAAAIARFVHPRPVARVLVSGGGAHNPALLDALVAALDGAGVRVPVEVGTGAPGVDPDAREAVAFALLGWAHLRGIAGNVPACTGASGLRVLGSLTPAPGRPAPDRPAAAPAR